MRSTCGVQAAVMIVAGLEGIQMLVRHAALRSWAVHRPSQFVGDGGCTGMTTMR
jgi:hypothetical protein